ncbi:MAG: hypothetical protein E5V71_12385, partial [Mesorhizobium sp.]
MVSFVISSFRPFSQYPAALQYTTQSRRSPRLVARPDLKRPPLILVPNSSELFRKAGVYVFRANFGACNHLGLQSIQLRQRETFIMSLSATIAPHLPFLRRFSRAVS